nr:hypothetical protein [Bacteroidota bacterium]
VLIFVALSHLVFQKIEYARFVYPIIALGIINIFGNINRNCFLKNCFPDTDYKKIRLIENFIAATPFFLFLLYKHEYILAISLYAVGVSLSFFNKVNRFHFVLPTPFFKRPFEFITGFRKTYWVFLLSYMLTYISISFDNFNLGIFALIVTFLTCLTFYTKPEPLFYVWINAGKPVDFLKTKIRTASIHSFFLSFPIMTFLILFNIDNTHFVLIFEILGILYVITSLLGKYAYYPSDVNLIQGFVIVCSIIFPPILLAVIPYLYTRSKQNLDSILT